MDPDHLAIIDGITRAKAAQNERLALWTGFLFSVGHGGVVILVAIGISLITGTCTDKVCRELGQFFTMLERIGRNRFTLRGFQ